MLSYNFVENNGNDKEMVEASSASSDYVFRIVTSMNSEFVDDQNRGIDYFIILFKLVSILPAPCWKIPKNLVQKI